MAAIEEADQRSVSESVSESVSDAVGQQSYETLGRNASDALLDISIEAFLKELEPHKYHCYSGWEEAVSKSNIFTAHLIYCLHWLMIPLS